ncbi:MAG: YwiC-like family protein [Anaerolineales bacterium]|nr:YwiC-like family protein [Anaerolineales bacterium]
MKIKTFLRKQYAIPGEHGAWVFLLSPLLIGLVAARSFTPASALLVVAALAAFLIRQPVTIAVKAFSGRRSPHDLAPAAFWAMLYGIIGLAALAGLLVQGFGFLLYLALPGILVFAWHLWLVSRRAERRQAGVEIVGSGVLALAAPAALWVGTGQYLPEGWWLFALTWLQSAASIVHAYLRLAQRELAEAPPRPVLLRMARRALLYTTFNLVIVLACSLSGILPSFLFLAYLLQWCETVYGALRPAIGIKPTQIGLRQLAVSTLFTVVFIVFWLAG